MALPLENVRIVEMVGIGPTTHASMMLADMGADIIRIERPLRQAAATSVDPLNAELSSRLPGIRVDLKDPDQVSALRELIDSADVIMEGYRPGVMERLGLGPDTLSDRLVYARMTGWGQDGPLSTYVGHDINYISISGALRELHADGQPPLAPFNFIGDYGGGSMLLVAGVLAGLVKLKTSGLGSVVDAAMVDGSAAFLAVQFAGINRGTWGPGTNSISPRMPYYGVYETSDHEYISVGAIEPQFYSAFMEGIDLDIAEWPQSDVERWPAQIEVIADIIKRHSRAQWTTTFEGKNACVSPVLSKEEAIDHPHIASRGTIVRTEHGIRTAPAPRFMGDTAERSSSSDFPAALARWGVSESPRLIQLQNND